MFVIHTETWYYFDLLENLADRWIAGDPTALNFPGVLSYNYVTL